MAEKTSVDLVKIGPGLGRRSKIWTIVKKKLSVKSKHLQILTPAELTILDRLTEGTNWMELVPDEWKETYGAMFDTSHTREPIVTKTRDQIVRDVPRTFSLYIEHARYLRLQFPTDMKPYCDALQSMLEVACHQSFGCGYCQGMNFLAATFLLSEGNQRSAFIIVSYLLKQCHLEILYNPKCSSLLEYMEYYEQRLEIHNPHVYHHLQNEEFPPLCYTVEWFTTCFLVSSPGELSACVLDLILCGYDDIMIRVGLALMDHLETVILQSNAEKLQLNFKKMLLLANCVEVMTKALTIPSDNMEGVSRIEFMKQNCETMDPNDEWVNTMQSPCRIHKGSDTLGDEASAKSDPTSTVLVTCTCSTPPLEDLLDGTPARAHSVDIGVLRHSNNSGRSVHEKAGDSHTHALLMGHAQSSPQVTKMQDHAINEDYVQSTLDLSGEQDEHEHSSVDSPTGASTSSDPSAHRNGKNYHSNGHIHDKHGNAGALPAPHSASSSTASRQLAEGSNASAQLHRSRSASQSQAAPSSSHSHSHSHHSNTAKSSSTSGAGGGAALSSASTGTSASDGSGSSASKTSKTAKESKRERRPSSASVISTAFKALYK